MREFLTHTNVIIILGVISVSICYIMGIRLESMKEKWSELILLMKMKSHKVNSEQSESTTRIFNNKDAATKIYSPRMHPLILSEFHEDVLMRKFLIKCIPEAGLIIGKDPKDSEMIKILGNDYIGREHVILKKKNGRMVIQDAGSRNGIFDVKTKEKVEEIVLGDVAGLYLADPKLNIRIKICKATNREIEIYDNKATLLQSHKYVSRIK